MCRDRWQFIEDISKTGLSSTSSSSRSSHDHQQDKIQNSAFLFRPKEPRVRVVRHGGTNGCLGLECLSMGKSKAAARSRVLMTAFFDSWGYKKTAQIKQHKMNVCDWSS